MAAALIFSVAPGCHAPNPDYDRQDGRGGADASTGGAAGGYGGNGGPGGDGAGAAPALSTGGGGASLSGPTGSTDAATFVPDARGLDAGGPDASAAAPDGAAARTDVAPAIKYVGDLKKALTLYLPLDDKVGAVAADASGKKSSASLKSVDAQAAWIEGRFGTAVALAGSSWNGWIDVSGTALTSAISEDFTVGMWIWRTGTGGTLLSRGVKGVLLNFGLDTTNLNVQMNTSAAYKLSLRAGAPVPADRWTHVALTFDHHEVRLYVDGTAVGAVAYAQAISLDTVSYIVGGVAQADHSVTTRFTGKIDEVVLYTRALTPAEIGGLAAGARPSDP